MRYEFTVPGECRGKMRPKASVFAGHARVHTPGKQVEYENWVRLCFCREYGGQTKPAEGTLVVYIDVYHAFPKSMPKYKRKMAQDGELFPTKKPDVDNCAKSILDALNGIAYKDDSQVIRLSVCKRYASEAHVDVKIQEWPL